MTGHSYPVTVQSWEVEVRVNGDSVLTIGHNHLTGIENIDDYADTVESCANHLLAFIGRMNGYGAAAQASPDCGAGLPIEVRLRAIRATAIEECARIAEAQKQDFLSPEYAANQPFGSLCERFACDEVAKAIRTLAAQPLPAADGARTWDTALADRVMQLGIAGAKQLSISAILGLIAFVRDGEGSEPSSTERCICQEQHRRGYCTEPGCPHSSTEGKSP